MSFSFNRLQVAFRHDAKELKLCAGKERTPAPQWINSTTTSQAVIAPIFGAYQQLCDYSPRLQYFNTLIKVLKPKLKKIEGFPKRREKSLSSIFLVFWVKCPLHSGMARTRAILLTGDWKDKPHCTKCTQWKLTSLKLLSVSWKFNWFYKVYTATVETRTRSRAIDGQQSRR